MKRKINYSRVFILGVFLYIIFQLTVALIGIRISTVTLKQDKYEVKLTKEGIIVRDEYLVKSDIDGILSTLVDEGEKVQQSSEVAIIYNKSIDENVNNEIDKMKNDENPLNQGALASKKEQLKILNNRIKSNTSTFYAETSGVVSFKYDNNEEKYNIESLESINKDDIYNIKNNYKNVTTGNEEIKSQTVVYRMVNNNDIYLAYESKEEELYDIGSNVKVKLGNEELAGEIYNNYKKQGYFITIIKINQQNTGIYDTRKEEFDIIYKQMECLRIPKKSIVTKNKETGVFVVDEETKKPYFIALKGISYEDENYIYIDFRSNEKNGIDTVKIHDRIILKPNFINKRVKLIS